MPQLIDATVTVENPEMCAMCEICIAVCPIQDRITLDYDEQRPLINGDFEGTCSGESGCDLCFIHCPTEVFSWDPVYASTTPLPPPCDDCDCQDGGDPETTNDGTGDTSQSGSINTGGVGMSHEFTYSNNPYYSEIQEGAGTGWINSSQPRLIEDETSILVQFGPKKGTWFDLEGSIYTARNGSQRKLVHDTSNYVFVLTMPDGTKWEFHDFDQATEPEGSLHRVTSPGGVTTTVVDYNLDDRITETQRTIGNTTEKMEYEYLGTSDPNAGLLSQVTFSRVVGTTTTYVERNVYSYYGSSESFGNLGDRKKVIKQVYNGSIWVNKETYYYRYYKPSETGGFTHGLKFVVNPDAYQAMVDDSITPESQSTTDTQIAAYASYYFEYNAAQRITKEAQGGGTRVFEFSYMASQHADGPNDWSLKTMQTESDGSSVLRRKIFYTNHRRQSILKDVQNNDASERKIEYRRYNDDYKLTLLASPSAIASYDDDADPTNELDKLIVTYATDGLGNKTIGKLAITTYYTSGAFEGHKEYEKVQNGEDSTAIVLAKYEYQQDTIDSTDFFKLNKKTVYKNEDGTGAINTFFDYDYHSGLTAVQQKTTTLPLIPFEQNGDGDSDSSNSEDIHTRIERFDIYGNLIWEKDERGVINYHEYDVVTGKRIKTISDVDTTMVSNEPDSTWQTTSTGLHRIDEFEYDDQGRLIKTLGPEHKVDIDDTATDVRRVSWTVYDDANRTVLTAQGYATTTTEDWDTFTLINPVSITKKDEAGRVIEQITAVRASTSGELTINDTFAQSSYTAWKKIEYDIHGRVSKEQVYHDIPESIPGVKDTNYAETTFGYDDLGRQDRIVAPDGTITRFSFDTFNNLTETRIGTNDTDTSANNMVLITTSEYGESGCSGCGGASDKLTTQIQHIDSDSVEDADNRQTDYLYDWRGRLVYTVAPDGKYTMNHYDNLNRTIKVERYYDADSDGTGSDDDTPDASDILLARTETSYDDLGRAYQTKNYTVSVTRNGGGMPISSSVGNVMLAESWYDMAGNTIKQIAAGANHFTKTVYNGLGQVVKQYVAYDTDEVDYSEGEDVAGDTILEQSENTYDAAGNLIQNVSYQRLPTATGTDPLTSTTAQRSTTAAWHDPIGRQIASANLGTASFDRTASANQTIPSSSDTVLVTLTDYNDAGQADKTTDPKDRVSLVEFDAMGRTTKTIENYIPVTDTNNYDASATDQNVTIEMAYTPGGKLYTLTAKNVISGSPVTTEDQVTTYVYGTDKTSASPLVYRNDLLVAVIYPDSDDTESLGSGSDTVDDRVEYVYNRQGEMIKMTDQNGTVHEYDYDMLGRQTADRVTNFETGSGIDESIQRIERSYNALGQLEKITSYSDPDGGSAYIVNQVKHMYNDLGQLTTDYQEHDGAVVEVSTLKVQYDYDLSFDGNNLYTKGARPTKLTYPSTRDLYYDYGTAGGTGDQFNRVKYLFDNNQTTRLATYNHLFGVGGFALVNYDQIETYSITTDVLDAFGRVTRCNWNYNDYSDVVNMTHGYDRLGNRLYRKHDLDESVFYTIDENVDELYTYDNVNRLKDLHRGVVSTSGTPSINSTTFAEDWTLDKLGNWTNYKQDTDGNSTWDLTEARTHNVANEITAIDTSPSNVAHDRNGNMTYTPNGTTHYRVTYDAWNRMVKVKESDNTTVVAEYAYDGRNFMIVRKSYNSGTLAETRHFYYTDNWQCIEERLEMSGTIASTPKCQYVWGTRYVDDLVLRDRDTNDNGTLNEQLYALTDANWNVVALADSGGYAVERYTYDAYGTVTYRDENFVTKTTGSYAWEHLYTGRRLDPNTGLMYYRNRWYHTGLGRFVSRDPIGYRGSKWSLYEYIESMPLTSLDPYGISKADCQTAITNFLSTADYKAMSAAMTKAGCPLPKMDCSCKITGGGQFDHDKNELTVRYTSGTDSARVLANILKHEFVHAYDYCLIGDRNFNDCDERICSEIRAYSSSGQCDAGGAWNKKGKGNNYEDRFNCIVDNTEYSITNKPDCPEDSASRRQRIKELYSKCVAPPSTGTPPIWPWPLPAPNPNPPISTPNPVPPNCFLAGTLVATKSENKPIEELVPGMMVWSFCHKNDVWELKEVTKVASYPHYGEVIEILIDDSRVKVTGEHPFWVQGGKSLQKRKIKQEQYSCDYVNNQGYWVSAKNILNGDILFSRDKKQLVVSGIQKKILRTSVYSITVETPHNYAVGPNGLLVHNKIVGY